MKECKKSDCEYPVFSSLYCKYHQYLKPNFSKPKLKRTRIKYKKKTTGEKDFFDALLPKRKQESFISKMDLQHYVNSNLKYSIFAHVIPKNGTAQLTFVNTDQRNELLRLNEENVVLLTPYEHNLFDQGTDKLRKIYAEEQLKKGIYVDWDKLYDYRDYMMEKIKGILYG